MSAPAGGRLAGRVALITGGARGQGRSHAVRLAGEGADVVLVDLCSPVDSAPYPMADPADLEQTVKLVEDLDRRALAVRADVRDLPALQAAVADGLAAFGRLDVVVANAGIAGYAPSLEMDEATWQEMIDINLTGVWKTVRAAAPAVVDGGRGGAIVLTSSVAGLMGFPNLAHYCAAKHGLVGLMKVLAVEFAPHRIRVNSVHPTNVDTDMIQNPAIHSLFSGMPDPDPATAAAAMQAMHALPIPWVDPIDISNAVAWLASDEARYVTGVALPVDGGMTAPFKLPHAVSAAPGTTSP
ncbi:mycofactocin-coupled SDR family oxidoreductase [Pseudonocardia petroleophila]|uniref:Mycofactocin-coupled SDR family oxidoreductase n=1 Tax=Pseudonocardia petroleophila TaxID=37331 RepID=A0A7G7MCU6_9PSEU|nr:mycofactocin-coupled SDR family oxidoreductase [Pseudonocardia petroleophila]QNG50607.1 mycofactocin-coupled SDR family oxidoreductase [Pseudonocardia petroleophila]